MAAEEKRVFHVVDYIVFAATITISLGIGVFFSCTGGKQKTNKEYLMGDRNMKLFPVAISILVTFVSAIGLLGTPAEMYAFGTQYSMHLVAAGVGVFMSAFLFVPLLYPLKLTSSFEYYELRFQSRATRLTGMSISLVMQVFSNGMGLLAPSMALEAVSGFPVWASMLLCGLSATIYTTMGGMKAVIWTDVFQSVIIIAGLLVVVTQGVIVTGGFGRVWELNAQWDRIEFFNFNPDPTERATIWSVAVMMTFLYVCIGSAQPAVQRFSSLPTQRLAKQSILLNVPGLVIFGVLTCLTGMVAFAYYANKGCDPMKAGLISNPNQILPFFVMEILPYPGLPGLFVACLYSAALSTASSSLNAMAAIFWEDLLKPHMTKVKESTAANITKASVVVFGALSVAMGFIVQFIGGTFIQIAFSIMGSTLGPLIGMLFLGAMCPKAGSKGALLGVYIGLVFSMWISMGSYINGSHTIPRPSPSYNCSVPVRDNASMVISPMGLVGDGYQMWNGTDWDDIGYIEGLDVMNETGKMSPALFHGERTWLQAIYSISYLYYPFIGIVIVLTIGNITSFIPGFEQQEYVPDKYLFPFISAIRRRLCGAPPAESLDYKYPGVKENGEVSEGLLYDYKAGKIDLLVKVPLHDILITDTAETNI